MPFMFDLGGNFYSNYLNEGFQFHISKTNLFFVPVNYFDTDKLSNKNTDLVYFDNIA